MTKQRQDEIEQQLVKLDEALAELYEICKRVYWVGLTKD